MTESKLEKMVGSCALVGVGVSTIGELAAGMYGGYTGEYVPGSYFFNIVAAGFVSQTFGMIGLGSKHPIRDTIQAPIVPMLSIVCYIAGYNIGKLLK